MPTTIRLTRMGRAKRPFYRLVVVDSRTRRDGAYVDQLGYYDPFQSNPYRCEVDVTRAVRWLERGAEMSDTARSLLRNEGVLYRWHLQRQGIASAEIDTKVEEYLRQRADRREKMAEQERKAAEAKARAEAKAKADAEAKAKAEAQAQAKAEAKASADEGSGSEPEGSSSEGTQAGEEPTS